MNTLSCRNNLSGIEDVLADFFGRENFFNNFNFTPLTDVIETKEGYELKIDLPGFEDKDISVRVEKGILKISGKIEEEKETEENKFIVRERTGKKFERNFRLPEKAISEAIEAKLDKGVLKIVIKKGEEEKARTIEIK